MEANENHIFIYISPLPTAFLQDAELERTGTKNFCRRLISQSFNPFQTFTGKSVESANQTSFYLK